MEGRDGPDIYYYRAIMKHPEESWHPNSKEAELSGDLKFGGWVVWWET